MKKQNSGFSLIELLVVIVIMGILATISIGTFSGFFQQARDAKRKSFVDTVASIIKAENASNWKDDTTDNCTSSPSVAATLDANYCKYMSSGSGIGILLSNNDVLRPTKQDFCTLYCYNQGVVSDVSDNQFFVATYMEKDQSAFINGTAAGMTAAATAIGAAPVTKSNFTCNTANPITLGGYTCNFIEQ